MRRSSRILGRRTTGLAAGLLAVSLLAAGCGGTKAGEKQPSGKTLLDMKAPETGLDKAGTPKRGGKLIYGVEADSSGYCLPEGQLAISGMMVVRAVYDTLTVPNNAGEYVPYLAKSIDHNADYTEWTIGLREGITFHDGSKLDSQVVKDNLDAYRGTFPGRSPLLFKFVLQNIDSVSTDGPLTVKVKTKVPWVAFPAYLYSSSRMGIMAEAQLKDKDNCATNLIGTGPFKFTGYTPNQKLTAERNPDYWQIAPDGKPYPYVDSVEFRIIPDGQVRNNAIQTGDINIMHTSNTEDLSGPLKKLRDSGKVNMLVSEDRAEVSFIQLNNSKPPFDDPRMRKALAMGADRSEINQLQNNGVPTVADGPFAPDSPGYLKDPGFPQYNQAEARKLVKEYVAEGKGHKASFTLTSTTDPSTRQLAELVQTRAAKVGVKVKIVLRDQAALINDAIGKQYEAMLFRNYPGGDPDINYVWWYGAKTNPVNFGGYDDATINKLLDEGRSETDPAKRKQIYQDINRQFAKEVHNVWAWYTPWGVVEASNVHNILGPPLPGADASKPGKESTDDPAEQPNRGLATGHSLLGLWIG